MIPKDPVMLLSYINLKLRDYYASLDALCEDLEISKLDLQAQLEVIDYRYEEEKNQFI